MTDGKERVHCEIPADLKERLRQSEQSQTDTIVEALELYWGEEAMGTEASIRRQINRYREQKARGEQLVQSGEEMIKEANRGINNLQSRLDQLEASSREYDEALEEMLNWMEEHTRPIFVGMSRLDDLAAEFSRDPESIHEDLRDRSDLPEEYFSRGAIEETPTLKAAGGDDDV